MPEEEFKYQFEPDNNEKVSDLLCLNCAVNTKCKDTRQCKAYQALEKEMP